MTKFNDLRDFIHYLEQVKQLIKVDAKISPDLEMSYFCKKTLNNNGPALLFTNPMQSDIPVLANLFGSVKRIALAIGKNDLKDFRDYGEILANLKNPKAPSNLKDAFTKIPLLKELYNMLPKVVNNAQVHELIINKNDVDLSIFPIWRCHSEDIAPLITWGLVVTKGPHKKRQNLGIYRQQVISKNKVIMRWLKHRGGAMDYLEHKKMYPDKPYPIAVVIGCDPATIIGAVTPVPDDLSEYQFAGLLRGSRTSLVKCVIHDLHVPSNAEIVLEGFIYPNDEAKEGPFGDHTGYYNEVETFPVFTIETITMRKKPIYHGTYTGKPIDEPAILAIALNEMFIPFIQKQYPEIVDCYLPPEACSYRMAVIAIKKSYPGHAKKIMFAFWSFLTQFSYTKYIIVVDDDINIRDLKDVIWAVSTRVDPKRDMIIIDNTPIDYLDFASPKSGLGSKIGIDATNKIDSETAREWGRIIKDDKEVATIVDKLYSEIFNK